MARDLFNRYIWLVDTIKRYGRITRQEIDECWRRTAFSDGQPLPRRTFHNYREAAEKMFSLEIKCDPATFEYYISGEGDAHKDSVTNWLLNSAVTNELLASSHDVASRIFIEDVPSAREFLAPAITALRENRQVRFDYLPYSRTIATRDVIIEPYFLKIFRQRWYITGRNVAENRIKTYALDRMSGLTILSETFEPDECFDPEEYFRHSFGIIVSEGEVKDIVLKVEPRQAKYFRALPLHTSQEEFVHDSYSIFRYRLRITDDFITELLSHGPELTVLEPQELRAIIKDRLQRTLDNYTK